MSLTICHGSILDSKAEYIVNPANGHLRHGGGLAKVIADAAVDYPIPDRTWRLGYEMPTPAQERALDAAWVEWSVPVNAWKKEQEDAPLIATGNAYMTSAGALPFKGIIHAVGPIWNGGDFLERDLLEMAYENAGLLAVNSGAQSVAFPAISAGIFGMPIDIVAAIAVGVCSWLPEDFKCELWAFSDEHVEAFRKEAGV